METRFLLFVGETYYAKGGAHDFHNSDSHIHDLLKIGKRIEAEYTADWWHIMDLMGNTICAGSEFQAHGVDDLNVDETGRVIKGKQFEKY